MKLNEVALAQNTNKLMFLISEQWQGLSPAADYTEQAEAVSRTLDSIEYIENAIDRGTVVLAHKDIGQAKTLQLVTVTSLEDLNGYLKVNEAHARLPLTCRAVLPLSDWDEGMKVFEKMRARAEVRAAYEAKGLRQPNQYILDQEADALLAKLADLKVVEGAADMLPNRNPETV